MQQRPSTIIEPDTEARHIRIALPANGRTLLAVGVTVLCWASAFPGIRAALVGYSPAHVALLRYLIASVVLAGYAAATRMGLPRRRDLPGILLTGLIGIAVYNVALNTGETHVAAGVASLIVATVPIFVALLATALLGERIRPLGWLGMVVSFVGVAVIALGASHTVRFDLHVLAVLVAAVAQSLYFVGQKPYLARYTAFHVTTYAIWGGTLCMLPFFPGLAGEMRAAPLDATLVLAYLGLFPGAIAYVSWAYALARMPASTTAGFLYLVPALTILIAWLWLAETPTPLAVAGGAAVLAGVILLNTRGRAA